MVFLWGWCAFWQYLNSIVPDPVAENLMFTHTTFIVQIIFMIIFVMITYDCDVWGSIFTTTIAYSLQHFTHRLFLIVCTFVRMLMKDTQSQEQIWLSSFGVIIWVFIFLISYSLWYYILLSKVSQESLENLVDRKMQVVISGIVILVSIYINSLIAYHKGVDDFIILMDFILSIIISFLIIILDCTLVLEKKHRRDNERLDALLKEEESDYLASKDSLDILNIKLHDIKHLLQTLDNSTSPETISNIKEGLVEFEQKIKTGNEAIDVIIGKKEKECKEKNITFSCFLNARNLEYISPYEIYTLFDNALNNAIDACSKCDDEFKVLSIRSERTDTSIKIIVTNYFNLSNKPNIKDGVPQTKGDRNYHGFGFKSMQMLVKKYDGDISCELIEDTFNLYINLPLK